MQAVRLEPLLREIRVAITEGKVLLRAEDQDTSTDYLRRLTESRNTLHRSLQNLYNEFKQDSHVHVDENDDALDVLNEMNQVAREGVRFCEELDLLIRDQPRFFRNSSVGNISPEDFLEFKNAMEEGIERIRAGLTKRSGGRCEYQQCGRPATEVHLWEGWQDLPIDKLKSLEHAIAVCYACKCVLYEKTSGKPWGGKPPCF